MPSRLILLSSPPLLPAVPLPLQAHEAVVADDDVVQQLEVQQGAGGDQGLL